MRRNTVRYRVQRAVELRGRPIDKDRLELEIALGACRRLGRAVLAPSPVGRDGA
nr:helix-turn-helix domain-containing protein [Streptomyces arboris]